MTQQLKPGTRVRVIASPLYPAAIGQSGTVVRYPYAGRKRVMVLIDPDPGTHNPDWKLVFFMDELEEIK